MAKTYRSRIAETVHKTAEGLHQIGAIDKTTMRDFDVMCLTLVKHLSAREIQQIRKNAGVSQEVFSKYLNVPVTLVSQWERGEKKPSALRLNFYRSSSTRVWRESRDASTRDAQAPRQDARPLVGWTESRNLVITGGRPLKSKNLSARE